MACALNWRGHSIARFGTKQGVGACVSSTTFTFEDIHGEISRVSDNCLEK